MKATNPTKTFALDTHDHSRKIKNQKFSQEFVKERESDTDGFSSEDFDENIAYVSKSAKSNQGKMPFQASLNIENLNKVQFESDCSTKKNHTEDFKDTEIFNSQLTYVDTNTNTNQGFVNTLKLNLKQLDEKYETNPKAKGIKFSI